MILTIKITKEVLERSAGCGRINGGGLSGENCAVSLALRDILPKASVATEYIMPFGRFNVTGDLIQLSDEAINFIKIFDGALPSERLELQPFSFEITLPDSVIEAIEIGDVEKSETLELINN